MMPDSRVLKGEREKEREKGDARWTETNECELS